MKTTVGVSQSVRSANVANSGMQSHCGTPAFNARKQKDTYMNPQFLLATRTFCTKA